MTRTHHARTAAAITLVAATLSSCTSDPQPTAAPTSTVTAVATPTPTLEPASPTATPTPTPSVSVPPGNEPPPPLELVGEDFEAIVRSHEAYSEWAFSHPSPDLLNAIYHPECPCMEQNRLLEHYYEQGLRWVGPPLTVASVEVHDRSHPDIVILKVVRESAGPARLIDREGTVHDEVPKYEPYVEEDVFVRDDADSPWLLIDYIQFDPVGSQGEI